MDSIVELHPAGVGAPVVSGQTGPMTTVRALDHIVLVVGDVERTLDWYVRHAGLLAIRVDEWRRGEAPFPSLRIDETTIIDVLPGDPTAPGRLDHICFVVDPQDLAGIESDSTLEVVDRGERFGARGMGQSVYVRDPDGLMVEFRTYPDR